MRASVSAFILTPKPKLENAAAPNPSKFRNFRNRFRRRLFEEGEEIAKRKKSLFDKVLHPHHTQQRGELEGGILSAKNNLPKTIVYRTGG